VREYDAETGSFLRKDPSGFGGGTNLYAYAWGDPVNFVDVDGAVPSLAGGVIGAFEGALFGYVDEMLDQALDPERMGFDCAAVHSAMLKGAIGGALFGALTGGGGGGGKRSGGGRGSCSGGLCEAGNCFAAGTAVQTEGGEVAIDALRVGDAVWAEDDATGALSLKRVTAVHARDAAHR
jgi:Hint domain